MLQQFILLLVSLIQSDILPKGNTQRAVIPKRSATGTIAREIQDACQVVNTNGLCSVFQGNILLD